MKERKWKKKRIVLGKAIDVIFSGTFRVGRGCRGKGRWWMCNLGVVRD